MTVQHKITLFERKQEKLATRSIFIKRLFASTLIAIGMIALVLFIGIAGYHWIAKLEWVDALLEASMILSGMGPVKPLVTDAAKIFASLYALFSGIVFIGVMGIIFSPIVHRMLHNFHIDESDINGLLPK